MALVLADRVRETTTVTGTGTATLLGAVSGYQSFAAIGNGNTTYYCIADQSGAAWEVGIGTYTASGTTLARTTVLASSNANALVSFAAGTKYVFCTYAASKAVSTGDTGTVTNTMLAGSISNDKLSNSAITINGTSTSLGGSVSVGTVTSVGGTGSVSGLSLSGTVTGSGNLTLSGTLSASIDNISDEHRVFNNSGDNHATRSSFDAQGAASTVNFGYRYVQGSTNGPGVNSAAQYYSWLVGLGNDYAYNTYGMQIAYPRNVTTPYISVRYQEGGVFGAWQKISAGYADTSGACSGNAATATTATTATSATTATTATTANALNTANNYQVNSLGVGTAASGTTGEIRATNSISSWYSDQRLKDVIGTIDGALDKVDKLSGIIYTQNKLAEQFGYNNYDRQVGVIAQQVREVLPEAVKPAPFDIAEDGSSISGDNYLTVQYEKLVPLLIEAIKELRAEVKSLKNGG